MEFPGCYSGLLSCRPIRRVKRQISKREVSFRSLGVRLRGFLFVPERCKSKPPVVVLAHGFSATQDMGLVDTALAICQRCNCAALTYDHWGFGRSEGQPQHFDHWAQAVGYLDAVTYLVQAESNAVDIDRIIMWGESLSSRLVMVAGAVETRVKAIIMVTPPCGRSSSSSPEPTKSAEMESASLTASPRSSGVQVPTEAALAMRLAADEGHVRHPSAYSLSTEASAMRQNRLESYTSDISSNELTNYSEEAVVDNHIFTAMATQLETMRAKSARLEDTGAGENGGAVIPAFQVRKKGKVRRRAHCLLRALPRAACRRRNTQ